MVRIRFPPAVSQRTFGSCVQRPWVLAHRPRQNNDPSLMETIVAT